MLLPHPDGPTTTTNSPGSHVRLTSRRAATLDPSKFLLTCLMTSRLAVLCRGAGAYARVGDEAASLRATRSGIFIEAFNSAPGATNQIPDTVTARINGNDEAALEPFATPGIPPGATGAAPYQDDRA